MGAIEHFFNPVPSGGRKPAGTLLSQRRLMSAIAYMRMHVAEAIELRDIAAAANLSVFHFARAFRNTTGITPYQYLLDIRMDRVRELLLAGDMPLAEIAARAGFADQSHMSNAFRRLTGMTPLGYRRERRDGEVKSGTSPRLPIEHPRRSGEGRPN